MKPVCTIHTAIYVLIRLIDCVQHQKKTIEQKRETKWKIKMAPKPKLNAMKFEIYKWNNYRWNIPIDLLTQLNEMI